MHVKDDRETAFLEEKRGMFAWPLTSVVDDWCLAQRHFFCSQRKDYFVQDIFLTENKKRKQSEISNDPGINTRYEL